MQTTVYLIRHATTDWNRAHKVIGQRDIGLNEEGNAQARALADALAGRLLAEVVASPLLRAVETAQVIAARTQIELARDPRLGELRVGRWEGMTFDEAAATPEWAAFAADPLNTEAPGGETLAALRDRALGAVEQALSDTPVGESIAVVTHATVIRTLLAHYLGAGAQNYHRLRVAPGSISILRFADDRQPPRVLAVNWRPTLAEIA